MTLHLPRRLTAVIERDCQTGLFVGSVPGLVGAHAAGDSIAEMRSNLKEVLALLLESGELNLESECIGILVMTA